MPALSVLAHHSEPSDPVLLRWVLDTFEAVLGYGPLWIVVPVSIVVVAFPIALVVLAVRSRRRQGAGADDGERDGRFTK